MTPGKGVLVLDIGTESVRAAIVDQNGSIVALRAKNTDFFSPFAGWAEQKPEEWWSLSGDCIRAITSQYPDFAITAIGIGAQMHAVVPVDGEGNLLMEKVPIWCDKRSAGVCENMQKEIPRKSQIEKTANLLIPSWTGPKIKWIKDQLPDVYRKTRVFLTAKDYLNYQFTGAFFTDFSEASGSFLFSWKTRNWDTELLQLFGIEPEKLPDIVPSSTIIGRVKPEVARNLGLKPEISVICGAGDMLCLLLGGGMFQEGRSCDVTGTAADVSVFSPQPLLTEHLMNIHHAIDGWISFGILDSGGGSLKWLRETFYQREDGTKLSYATVDDDARKVAAGANGLLFFPYLMGERLLGSPQARGSFFGLLPGHRKEHLARAVLEGVCFDLKLSLDEIERLYQGRIAEISVIGGGARSALWCQIKADIYRKKVFTLIESEGGIIGAAMLACSATTGEEVRKVGERWLQVKEVFHPDTGTEEAYARQYRLFTEFHALFQGAYALY